MANTGRPRSGTSSKNAKSSSSGKKTSTSSKRSASGSRYVQPQVQTGSGFSEGLKRFSASKAAAPLIFFAVVLLLVGIDLLVSWNKFGLFFKILGVEILIAVIIWAVLTLVFSGKNSKVTADNSGDEV